MNMSAMVLLALLGAGGTQTDPPATIQVTTEHYELDLRVDYAHETLQGSAHLTVRNFGSHATASVPLLLYRLMEVTAVRDATGRALAFDQDVVRFDDFDQLQVTYVQVRLPRALEPGERTTVLVDWSGRLLGYSETGMRYVHDHVDPSFTMIRNDAYAFPTVGVPAAKANKSAPMESYDYIARITVPDSLYVVNGGRLVGTREAGGLRTFEYHSLRPSWRMDFAIARYGLLESPPLRVFYLEEDSAGAARAAKAAEACMRLFADWFGPLHDTPALAFVEIPDGWGSQKDVTTIIQTAAAFRDSTRFHEIYHELAHLWQPEITDYPDPRWTEGLASFLEMLAAEKLDGQTIVDSRANQLITWLRQVASTHPRWRNVPMIDYGKYAGQGLTDLSYSVGALFFDLLYRLEGPEAFNRSLRTYYQTHAGPGGSTADLEATFSAEGPVDPAPLFRDWMHTTRWWNVLEGTPNVRELAHRYGGRDETRGHGVDHPPASLWPPTETFCGRGCVSASCGTPRHAPTTSSCSWRTWWRREVGPAGLEPATDGL